MTPDDSPIDPTHRPAAHSARAESHNAPLIKRLLDPGDSSAVPAEVAPVAARRQRGALADGAVPAGTWAGEAWDDEIALAANGSAVDSARASARAWRQRLRRFRWRAVRDGLALLGLGYAAFLFLVIAPRDKGIGDDAYAYWSVSPTHPYSIPEGQLGAFPYAPPIARLFEPFGNMPWETFLVFWLGVLVATIIWLGWGKTLLVLAFPPVAIELYHGNVNLLIAAAIALGFRYPATWAFVVFTKVTPGIGLLWFAVRREWRNLAIALGVTAVIAVGSFIIDRALWQEWFAALFRDSSASLGGPLGIPIWIRLPIAAAVVIWGARRGRPWTVALAATIAMPTLFIAVFAVLAAIPAIRRPELNPCRSDRSWGSAELGAR
jgi:hypothetical protein